MYAPEPKSISFRSIVRRSTNRFSSLISLWTTPFRWQAKTVSTTCRKKFRASCSSSIPFSVMKSKRSLHGSGLSITIINESCLSKQSMSLTTPVQPDTTCIKHTSIGTLSPLTCNAKLMKLVFYTKYE